MPDLTVPTLFDVDAAIGRQTCVTCGVSKLLECFGNDRSKATGKARRCKECARTASAAYRQANPEKCYAAQRVSHSRNPDHYRAATRASMRRQRLADPVAHNARQRAYYRANSERIGKAIAARRRRNPEPFRLATRRAKAMRRAIAASALSVPFTAAQLASRMAYWGARCYICRGPWQSIDHVKPYAAGGGNLLANLRPACRQCNSVKRDLWNGPAWAMSLIGLGLPQLQLCR